MERFIPFLKFTIAFLLGVLVLSGCVSCNEISLAENSTATTLANGEEITKGCLNGTNDTSIECPAKNIKPDSSPVSTDVDYVGYVVVPSFLVLGLVGNTLTIVVMYSKYFRKMSISIVLLALSISDTILICLHPHNKLFVRNWIGIDIRSQSLIGCKLFFLFFRTAKMSSSWLVVLLSMERFIAVVFPLKAKFVCTRRNVFISISVIYGALFIYNGVWTFASRIVNGKCVPHYPEPAQLSEIFIIIGTLVYSIIPVSFMLILTPIICFHLWRRIQNNNALGASSSKMSDEVKRTTVMLLGVSIAYMFLITPISIGHMISFSHDESIFETKHSGLAIYREISQILEQLNYSINFFLYVLCSKSFRDRVLVILRCIKPTPPKQYINQTKSTNLSSKLSKNSSSHGNDARREVDLNGIEAAVVETETQQPDTDNNGKSSKQENHCVAPEPQSANTEKDTSEKTDVASISPKMLHWIGTYDVPEQTDVNTNVCSKENDTVKKSEDTKEQIEVDVEH